MYFSPDELHALPREHRDQLFYLDKESTRKAYAVAGDYDVLCGDDGWGKTPFSKGCAMSLWKNWSVGEIMMY